MVAAAYAQQFCKRHDLIHSIAQNNSATDDIYTISSACIIQADSSSIKQKLS